jgi:hypothetical protein
MRVTTAILALFGIIWAYMGLGSFVLIFWLLQDLGTITDMLKLFVTAILMPTGYFVWWGWVFYSFKERFPFVTQQTFWIISLLHHIVCTSYIILSMDEWSRAWVFLAWLTGNIIVAAIFLVRRPWNVTQAEQGVAPNRSLPPTLNSTSSVRGSEDF